MKAICLQAYGDPQQFRIENLPVPQPGLGEVLIKLGTSAVNHFDLILRQGLMASYVPLQFPAILGGEGAGTIAAVGAGVTGLAVGDRVVAHFNVNSKGAYAEFAITGLAGIARLPEKLNFEQGATLAYAGLTGRQLVNALNIKAGDRVLVSGALGGVGRAAVQYLKTLGAQPVAGVLPNQPEQARQFAGEALDLTAPSQARAYDLAVGAAQPAAARLVALVRDGGQIASAVMTPEGANPSNRVNIQMIAHHDDPVMLQAIVDAAASGALAIPVAKTFRLDQVAEAHQALASGVEGKIVLHH